MTFPTHSWDRVHAPEELGYSTEKLNEAEAYSKSVATSAVIIVKGGRILKEWGDVNTRHIMFSARKSFTSVLYGKYVEQGTIDLDKTLAELGIDDKQTLSEEEKRATVRDVIKACSGVYHPVNYAGWELPPRGSHKPGTHFYYNNWDFNVAGAIFEMLTGKKIFAALKEDIADPIGMESYRPENGRYFHDGADPTVESLSKYPAFSLRMTARDMARFGLLMLNKGNWNGRQLIPASWVEESTRFHSDGASMAAVDGEGGKSGYGYMWWVAKKGTQYSLVPGVDLPEGTFMAAGAGGHFILVIPEQNMVIVHRVHNEMGDTENANPDISMKGEEFGQLLNLVFGARL